MHFVETNDSSEESLDICYRRKRPRQISSDEDELELQHNLLDNSCYEFSNLSLDTNVEREEEEWQSIQQSEIEESPIRHEHTRDAELLIGDVNCDDPFSLYQLFVTDSILQLMVDETNKYATQCGFSARRRKHEQCWEPVTIREIKDFMGILLIMGIVQMPDIRLYWSKDSIYGNKRIKNTMNRDRFLAILKCLHFSDNTTSRTEDPLNKIRNIMSEIITTFKNILLMG
ncbi:piggyBac transposable element-derived protein 4-like [Colletes gigas]|uniref:piggyBac transposable element-derived protein 4-like n=1 Tax=Colletes gigas TaxID=935657 RepID=UPI001C9B2214|nr:piggyBac transposable element-derived protein 4-like [Colletes gigas]